MEISVHPFKLRAIGVLRQTYQKTAAAAYQNVPFGNAKPLFDVPQRGAFHEFEEKRASPQSLRLSLAGGFHPQDEALNSGQVAGEIEGITHDGPP